MHAHTHAHRFIDAGQSRGYVASRERPRWRRRRLPRQTVSSIGIAGIAPGGKRRGEEGGFVRNIRGGYICMRGASRFFMVMGKVRGRLPFFNDEGNESRVRDAGFAIRRRWHFAWHIDIIHSYIYSFSLDLKSLCVWTGFFWKGCFTKETRTAVSVGNTFNTRM